MSENVTPREAARSALQFIRPDLTDEMLEHWATDPGDSEMAREFRLLARLALGWRAGPTIEDRQVRVREDRYCKADVEAVAESFAFGESEIYWETALDEDKEHYRALATKALSRIFKEGGEA